jgi:hypothetical protein
MKPTDRIFIPKIAFRSLTTPVNRRLQPAINPLMRIALRGSVFHGKRAAGMAPKEPVVDAKTQPASASGSATLPAPFNSHTMPMVQAA